MKTGDMMRWGSRWVPAEFVVYQIRNLVTGRVYIGHAGSFEKRRQQHIYHLRRGDHHAIRLQNSWRKHGQEAFVFEIISDVLPDEEAALSLEQQKLDEVRPHLKENGYNSSPNAFTNRGTKRSVATREKMSAWQRGVPKAQTHREKIAATLTGRPRDPAATEKQAAAMRGSKQRPDWTETVREAHRRRNNTPLYEAFGRVQYLIDWAQEFDIHKATLRNRVVRAGMTMAEALTLPVATKKA